MGEYLEKIFDNFVIREFLAAQMPAQLEAGGNWWRRIIDVTQSHDIDHGGADHGDDGDDVDDNDDDDEG